MTQAGTPPPGRLTYPRLAALLGAAIALAVAVGGYPTWQHGGPAGLVAAAAALAVNAVIFAPAGWMVCRLAEKRGPAAAGRALATVGVGRIILVVLLGLLGERIAGQPRMLFWGWVLGLYVLMALAEAWWAGRGLSAWPPTNKEKQAEP